MRFVLIVHSFSVFLISIVEHLKIQGGIDYLSEGAASLVGPVCLKGIRFSRVSLIGGAENGERGAAEG